MKNLNISARKFFVALLVLSLTASLFPLDTTAFASFSSGQLASHVLGQSTFTTNVNIVTAHGQNSPNNFAFDSSGNLWVADTDNNRVLMYPSSSLSTSGASATVELGQPSGTAFTSNTVNNPTISASTLELPSCLAFDSSGNLWVADSGNNRILKYPSSSLSTNGASATVELGQPSGTAFTSNTGNNGGISASTLSSPSCLAFDSSGNLWVADKFNNRVLMYPSSSLTTNGASATVELGQPSGTAFTSNTQNNGGLSASSLNSPQGIAFSSGNLWVTDTNNNRVLMYPSSSLSTNGASATVELGQPSGTAFTSGIANSGAVYANSLNTPNGLAFDSSGNLWVADSSNNRILKYPSSSLSTNGASATVELGQPSGTAFTSGIANNGGISASTLSSPSCLAFDSSGNLWVTDSSNNRVLMYPSSSLSTSGASATVELGQPSGTAFTSNTGNNGGISASTLSFPNCLAFDSSGNLWVTDTANRRVLMYPSSSLSTNGASATVELGQPSGTAFTSNTANNPTISASTLSYPEGIAFSSGNLWVADGGNHRVLMYPSSSLSTNGASATVELGQPSGTAFTSNTQNNGGLSASSLDFPQGIAFSSGNLWVADGGNHRVVEYLAPFANGQSASLVLGQSDFTTNTPAVSQSGLHLVVPSFVGLTFDSSGNLWVGDEGNSRVLQYLLSLVSPTVPEFPAGGMILLLGVSAVGYLAVRYRIIKPSNLRIKI
ncbi:MAG: NHL repeat-containing protein [Nitrososphaera sp.]